MPYDRHVGDPTDGDALADGDPAADEDADAAADRHGDADTPADGCAAGGAHAGTVAGWWMVFWRLSARPDGRALFVRRRDPSTNLDEWFKKVGWMQGWWERAVVVVDPYNWTLF